MVETETLVLGLLLIVSVVAILVHRFRILYMGGAVQAWVVDSVGHRQQALARGAAERRGHAVGRI